MRLKIESANRQAVTKNPGLGNLIIARIVCVCVCTQIPARTCTFASRSWLLHTKWPVPNVPQPNLLQDCCEFHQGRALVLRI